MGNEYFILMADIIKSRDKNQHDLMKDFKYITNRIKKTSKASFLSPITITLGDEFQSILIGPREALGVIFQIEEEIVMSGKDFKLRYILSKGKIDTPINNDIAYEMMGEGLTNARQLLGNMKRGNQRFQINIGSDKKKEALNHSFTVYQTIVDNWRVEKDYALVEQFLKYFDYKIVAEKMHKTRSQIWKRRKSLMIKEYVALKKIIEYLGGEI